MTAARSLDLLFFAGSDAVSRLIRFMEARAMPGINAARTTAAWSHVGIVVHADVLDDPRVELGRSYVWESTFSGGNVDGDWMTLGVQLRCLDDVLASYDGKIALARLAHNPLDSVDPAYLRRRFTDVFRELNGLPYETSPCGLLASVLRCCRCIRDGGGGGDAGQRRRRQQGYFCSELVAQVYCDLDILPAESVRVDNVVPMDFLPGCDADGAIPATLLALPLVMLKAAD